MQSLGFPLAAALRLRTVFEAHYHTSTLAVQLGLCSERVASLRRLEIEVSQFSDGVITFTNEDRLRWAKLSGCDEDRIHIVPFGVSCVDARFEQRAPRLVFLGNMYYEPNKRAMERIIRSILPPVRARCSNVPMMVVGDLPKDIQVLCEQAQVEVTCEVSDVRSYLHQCSVGLAPIVEGTGVRAKILQYLSCGLPVVATSVAAEGLNFPALFVEDNLQRYVHRCVELLQDPLGCELLVQDTLRILRKEYLWGAIAKRAADVYDEVMLSPPKVVPKLEPEPCGLPLWIAEVLRKQRFTTPLTVLDTEYRFGLASEGRIETFC